MPDKMASEADSERGPPRVRRLDVRMLTPSELCKPFWFRRCKFCRDLTLQCGLCFETKPKTRFEMNKSKRNKSGRSSRVKIGQSQVGREGLVFEALPTNRKVKAVFQGSGPPQVAYPGRTILSDKMKTSLSRHARRFWYRGTDDTPLQGPKWVVNLLAEAELYPDALRYLDRQIAATELSVFNSPKAILQSRRDRSAEILTGIENLVVPKTLRFRPTHPCHFKGVFAHGGFEFPILIRPAGSHTGRSLIKIDGPGDWDKIYTIPWGGMFMYMSQWMDFRSLAGEWRKLRLSITPQAVRMRHILYGQDWLIHSVQRGEEEVEKEMEILLNADNWVAMQQLGSDIRDRLGLDFFGVDLGWKSDSEFVLFEANASMSILSYHNMPEIRREDYVANLKKIEKDVWRSLESVCMRPLL